MRIHPFAHQRRVYCAGPLFNRAERREMEEIAATLVSDGFEVFVPHADGMEFAKVLPYLREQGHPSEAAGQWLHAAVFALDTYQVVEGCGSLVFNMNGRTPDEGGVAELTMAWMLGKPCVVFKEDVRTKIAGRDNPLVVGQVDFSTVSSMALISPALAAEIAKCDVESSHSTVLGGNVAQAVRTGKEFWRELTKLGAERPEEAVAEIVLGMFAGAL